MRFLTALSLVLASSAFCAEIRVDGETLLVDGEITKDDLGTFSGLLNASPEHTWGLISNGKQLRLMRPATNACAHHDADCNGKSAARCWRTPV